MAVARQFLARIEASFYFLYATFFDIKYLSRFFKCIQMYTARARLDVRDLYLTQYLDNCCEQTW